MPFTFFIPQEHRAATAGVKQVTVPDDDYQTAIKTLASQFGFQDGTVQTWSASPTAQGTSIDQVVDRIEGNKRWEAWAAANPAKGFSETPIGKVVKAHTDRLQEHGAGIGKGLGAVGRAVRSGPLAGALGFDEPSFTEFANGMGGSFPATPYDPEQPYGGKQVQISYGGWDPEEQWEAEQSGRPWEAAPSKVPPGGFEGEEGPGAGPPPMPYVPPTVVPPGGETVPPVVPPVVVPPVVPPGEFDPLFGGTSADWMQDPNLRAAGQRLAFRNVFGEHAATGVGPLAGYMQRQVFPLSDAYRAANWANMARELGGEVAPQVSFEDFLRTTQQQPTGLQGAYGQALQNVNYLRGLGVSQVPGELAGLFSPEQAADTQDARNLLEAAQRGKYSGLVSSAFRRPSYDDLFSDYTLAKRDALAAGQAPQSFLDYAAPRYGLY
jgi:hypothetical protein